MQRVVYFTAGITASSSELADIAKLNEAAEAPYEIIVVNSSANAKYGETNRLIPCDFVAGSIPTIYAAIDEIDPDSIPVRGLSDAQAVVNNGDSFSVTGGSVTATVEDGVATFVYTVTP